MINLEVLERDIKIAVAENDMFYATNLYCILKLTTKPTEFKQLEGLHTSLLLPFYKAIHRYDTSKGVVLKEQYTRLIELFLSDLNKVVKQYTVNISSINTESFSILFNFKDMIDSGLYRMAASYTEYITLLETVTLDYCRAFNIPFKYANIHVVCNTLYNKYIIQS